MSSIPPAGITPAAAFTPRVYTAQEGPPAILADAVDPATGDLASLLFGLPLADAFAIEALRLQRGTGAAARDTGNRFRELTHIESDAIEVVESMARQAFEPAELAGVARLERVSVKVDDADPGQVNVALEYRDLLAPRDAPPRRLVFSR